MAKKKGGKKGKAPKTKPPPSQLLLSVRYDKQYSAVARVLCDRVRANYPSGAVDVVPSGDASGTGRLSVVFGNTVLWTETVMTVGHAMPEITDDIIKVIAKPLDKYLSEPRRAPPAPAKKKKK